VVVVVIVVVIVVSGSSGVKSDLPTRQSIELRMPPGEVEEPARHTPGGRHSGVGDLHTDDLHTDPQVLSDDYRFGDGGLR